MCVHAASLWRRLKGKLRGEDEARRERKCRGKPLTAVAQGSGFLCRSRKTTVYNRELLGKAVGFFPGFCLQSRRPSEQVPAHHAGRKIKALQAYRSYNCLALVLLGAIY